MDQAIRAIRALEAVGWHTVGYRLGGGVYVAGARHGHRLACVAAESLEGAWPELWALAATVRNGHWTRD